MVVLCDCYDLFEDGVVFVVVIVDFDLKMILVGLDIFSWGFIYMREFGDFICES